MSSSQGTPPNAAGGNDPSMEDILASIRRILSEDEQAPSVAEPLPGAFVAQPQPAVPVPAAAPPPVAAKGVLTLDASMLVREPPPSAPISPGAPLAGLSAIVSPGMETQVPPLHFSPPVSAPVPERAPPPPVAPVVQAAPPPAPVMAPQPAPPAPMPVLAPTPVVLPPPSSSLVAPEAAAAASASVSSLVRTLTAERQTSVHRGGPTLEDLVREEMRPLLKQWLDTHLPPMVERLVRVEIERVVNRAAS